MARHPPRSDHLTLDDLDQIDRKILRVLQGDARIPMTELAERVGLSATPCSERVRRLERAGVITAYEARLNPQAMHAGLLIFVQLRLATKSGAIFDEFKREIQRMPHVLECHLVSGDFDYLVKVRLPEMQSFRTLLAEMLKLPGVRESTSYIVMEELKETLALPVPDLRRDRPLSGDHT